MLYLHVIKTTDIIFIYKKKKESSQKQKLKIDAYSKTASLIESH